MRSKRNVKSKKRLIAIVLIILVIACLFLILLKNRLRTPEENLKYIYSDKMDKGTNSPKFIHAVIGAYEGDLNPKAITKSTYYFVNDLIPKYLNLFKNKQEQEIKEYFNKNREEISLDIGIQDESEFVLLIKEIIKLNPRLEVEYSSFKMDEIFVNTQGTEGILHIKYNNNPEITVKVTVRNRIYQNKSSIKYSK